MSALLWRLADRVYPETHCGFRAKRSAFDMIFSLGQLYVAFIDPTKAFNLVSCDGFYWIFTKIGCPHKLLMVMQSFRSDRSGEFWWGQFRGFQHVRWYETRMCASPTLLASSLPSCWNIPSMHLRRVFSSIQDQMKSYSICPDWGPRPKYTKQSSGTCSLLMMWAWLPALDSCCRSLWTNSHKPVKTLAWLSALKKPTCWAVASNTPWGYWPNFLWSKEGFFSSGMETACLALLHQKWESRPERGFKPWLLQCQRSALPILSYQSNWKLGVMWVNNEIVDDRYRCRL